jgi:hypothetical protein
VSKNETVSGSWVCGGLFLLLTYMKLSHQIDWSWWEVTSPLWLPLAIVLVIVLGALLIYGSAWALDKVLR